MPLDTPGMPAAIYVWLVPSEHMLQQPGSWRIRMWDTHPFPEANYTLAASSETADIDAIYEKLRKRVDASNFSHADKYNQGLWDMMEALRATRR